MHFICSWYRIKQDTPHRQFQKWEFDEIGKEIPATPKVFSNEIVFPLLDFA